MRLFPLLFDYVILCPVLFIFILTKSHDLLKSHIMASTNWWKKTRVKLGLRKTELARKAGLSARTIVRLESGDKSITDETKSKVRIVLTK